MAQPEPSGGLSRRVRRLAGADRSRPDAPGNPLRAVPRFRVDRDYARTVEVSLRGASRLRIDVDNGNGSSYCDHLAVGFAGIGSAAHGLAPSRVAVRKDP